MSVSKKVVKQSIYKCLLRKIPHPASNWLWGLTKNTITYQWQIQIFPNGVGGSIPKVGVHSYYFHHFPKKNAWIWKNRTENGGHSPSPLYLPMLAWYVKIFKINSGKFWGLWPIVRERLLVLHLQSCTKVQRLPKHLKRDEALGHGMQFIYISNTIALWRVLKTQCVLIGMFVTHLSYI